MSLRFLTLTWFILILLFVGCSVDVDELEPLSNPLPTPTTFSLFKQGDETTVDNSNDLEQDMAAVPTLASLFSPPNSPTPRPSPVPIPTLEPYRPVITRQEDTFMVKIFTEDLNSDWEILEDSRAIVNMSSDLRVFEGKNSIAFTPEADYASLYFAVKKGAQTAYRAKDVVGVSFWLNGGDDLIALDEMAVAVIGSNEFSYWNPEDTSVDFPPGETFSETRLYFLDLNHSIPPETWVEVYLPLDSLIYDPVYNYVVGFYLKSGEGFRNTVYLDNVSLILVRDIEKVAQEVGEDSSSSALDLATEMVQADAVVSPTASTTPIGEDVTVDDSPQNEPIEKATPSSVENVSSECVVSPPDGWEIYAMKAEDVLFNLTVERNLALEVALRVNCLEESDVFSIGQNIWLPPLPVEGPEAVEPESVEPTPAEPGP